MAELWTRKMCCYFPKEPVVGSIEGLLSMHSITSTMEPVTFKFVEILPLTSLWSDSSFLE